MTVDNQDDPNSLLTYAVGAISCVLLFAIIIALEALFFWAQQREFDRKVTSRRPNELRQVQAESLEKINDYRWIDQEAGVVAIPIDEAMKNMVRDARTGGGGTD